MYFFFLPLTTNILYLLKKKVATLVVMSTLTRQPYSAAALLIYSLFSADHSVVLCSLRSFITSLLSSSLDKVNCKNRADVRFLCQKSDKIIIQLT